MRKNTLLTCSLLKADMTLAVRLTVSLQERICPKVLEQCRPDW